MARSLYTTHHIPRRYRVALARSSPWPGDVLGCDLGFWSAGINRHGEGDERALHRRTSDPR